MSLVDRILTCCECGVRFPWTIQEQKDRALLRPVLPATCPACRTVLGRIWRWQQETGQVVDRVQIVSWLCNDGFVPAAVSQLRAERHRGRFHVLLREIGGSRTVGLALDPWEALVVALWLETDIQAPPRPETRGCLPAPPALAVLLEAVPVTSSGRPPYQRIVSVITARACRRVSRIAGLGWILQAHTPLLVDPRLFLACTGPPPRRPGSGSPMDRFVAQLEALDDL